MSSEFDYDPTDMDELTTVPQLPSHQNSLASSRMRLTSSRRVLQDLQCFIEEAKNKENQRFENMKERQRNIGEEISKQQIQRDMKRKGLEQQLKNRQMMECTFKPKTNSTPGSKRNFSQFIESQTAHTQKVESKREQLKKTIEEKKQKATYRPNINQSLRRNSQKSQKAVHQRLYALKDKEAATEYVEPNNTFKPVINQRSKNMVRGAPVQDLLYNEALRRQEKDSGMADSMSAPKFERTPNLNNEKYAAQKFIKEFFYILNELQIEPANSNTVQYIMFNELLQSLGFININSESETELSTNERALIHDAYQILECSKPNARNICVFLLAILGIYHINPVNFDKDEESNPEDELAFEQHEGRKLQKHFDLFFRNRLSSDVPNRYQEEVQKYSFQPKINPLSEQMAEKHRTLMLEQATELIDQYPELSSLVPEDGIITHTDLLVLHKTAKDLQKERKKHERQNEGMKDCTFKPNTVSSSLACSKMTDGQGGFKKCFELYQHHKELQSKRESLKTNRQREIDPECTFQPQINKERMVKPPTVPKSKQTDQTLFRMHKGREEQAKKQKLLARGENLKKPVVKREPFLMLDVNLGEDTDKIMLYHGDEERLDEIAREFVKRHGLDSSNEEKLLELLEGECEALLGGVGDNA